MMQGLYEANLKLLGERYPDIAEKINTPNTGDYKIVQSEQMNTPNLHYTGLQPTLVFYHDQDPLMHVKVYLDAFMRAPARFFILLGMGLGYAAEALLRDKSMAIKLIIIERDLNCLKSAMQCHDLTNLIVDRRATLIAGCEERDLYVTLYNAIQPDFPGFKEVKFLPWPTALKISETYYSRVIATFRDIANTYCYERGNDPYDTLVAYEHFFANIDYLMKHPGAAYVKELFKNKPAVVVATGPSLKKNIHLLKQLEDSALIIAADASLRILHQHDIIPHIVTTIERLPGLGSHYKGLKHLDKTVFAAASFLHPSTLEAYSGPMLFLHRIYGFMLSLGFEGDALPMGASTGHMAYEVARHMGCNPIILVGQDLAFDSTGNTHTSGFIHGERYSYYDEIDRIDVPGNLQPLVKTCDDWFTGIKQYENRIAGWPGRLINATEGGARIHGSEIAKLSDVIVQHCSDHFNPRATLLSHLAQWKNPRTPKNILEKLNNLLYVIECAITICKKMKGLFGTTLKEIESSRRLTTSLKKQMNQIIPQIEDVLNSMTNTELMIFFGEYLYTDIFPLLMEWQVVNTRFTDSNWANAYRIKLADEFFGSLGQLCISLKEVLLDGRKRLEALS